eukprot:483041-Pleurochrysis_carterae.AAC.1
MTTLLRPVQLHPRFIKPVGWSGMAKGSGAHVDWGKAPEGALPPYLPRGSDHVVQWARAVLGV